MALTNTMGTYYIPFKNRGTEYTPQRCEFLQTSGSGTNVTSTAIFGSATAADSFHLTVINIDLNAGTTSAKGSLYAGENIIGYLDPVSGVGTGASLHYSCNYGPIGVMCGTTTTNTVYVNFAATAASIRWYAQGYRSV